VERVLGYARALSQRNIKTAFSIWLRGPQTTDSFCFRLSRSEAAASRIDSAMNGTGFWNDDARQIHRLSAVSTEKQGQSGLGIEARRRVIEDYLNGGRWELLAEYSRSRRASGRIASSSPMPRLPVPRSSSPSSTACRAMSPSSRP
jgi:hypothetical protein